MIKVTGTRTGVSVERLFTSLDEEALDAIESLELRDFQVTIFNLPKITSYEEYAFFLFEEFTELYDNRDALTQ